LKPSPIGFAAGIARTLWKKRSSSSIDRLPLAVPNRPIIIVRVKAIV
jgi:hypothetical protein